MTEEQRKQFNAMRSALSAIAGSDETEYLRNGGAENEYGLDYEDALEFAYENMRAIAQSAVEGISPIPAAVAQEAPVPANGSWSYSPQKGKPGECFLAQVWDGEGKELATVKATHDESVATSIAQLFAASPWLVHACNAALAAMNEMVPMPDHSDPGAIDDCKREIQEAIDKATKL